MPLTRIKSESIDTSGNLDIDSATLFVDTVNNRIGIGTSAPSYRLDVRDIAPSAVNWVSSVNESATSPGAGFIAYTPNSSGGAYSYFQVNGSGELLISNIANTATRFFTNALERMRIGSGGNVGIGTSSISAKFVVSDSGAAGFEFNPNSSGLAQIETYNRSTSAYSSLRINSEEIRLYTGSVSTTERMRIDASGNVGIGVSPSVRLDVSSGTAQLAANFNSSNASGVYVRFQNSGTAIGDLGSGGNLFSGGAAGDFGLTSRSGNLVLGTSSTERMRIDSSGRVLIGTTSAASGYVLQPYGKIYAGDETDATPDAFWSGQLTIRGNGYAGGLSLDATGMWVGHNSSGRALLFATDETERMRIDSTGRILIGSSSARANFLNASLVSAALQVEGNTAAGSIVAVVRNASGTAAPRFLLAKSRGTTIGSNALVQSGDGIGTITFQGADGSEFVEGAQISAVVDGTAAADSMPTRLEFHTSSTTGITERMRIDSSGRVTMPYQPTFWARATGTQAFTGTSTTTKVDFTGGAQYITSNKSSGWSQTNSRFTAPVAGTYEFIFSFTTQTTNATGPALQFYKNGAAASYGEVAINYYTAYQQATAIVYVDLAASDYVEFWITNYNSSTFTLDRGRTYFGGKLIG